MPRPTARRERIGQVQVGCELREEPAAGGRRHHYFRGVLRDVVGNLWICAHEHPQQDEAHACARIEFDRRVELGQLNRGGRQVS